MKNRLVKTTTVDSLAELLSRSAQQPVVIFKHSTTCPISAAAYDEMEQFDGDVALVEVQSARELSREIERQTGIPHESPQVLVVANGKVVWNASHWKVKAEAVAEAVSKAKTATPDTEEMLQR